MASRAGRALYRSLPKRGRIPRRPQHTFLTKQVPFGIQPFLLAPVIPGETLQNLLVQARVVTNPLKSRLVGWWHEMYFFYVKHRDLDERDDLEQMVLDINWDDSVVSSTADTATYHCGGGPDWAKLCLKRVTAEYFRNEGEAWDAYTVEGGIPTAQINGMNWTDSVTFDADMLADDINVPLLDTDTVSGADAVSVADLQEGMRQYLLQRQVGLTDMDYEDWLAQFGVRVPAVELHRPELLRYTRSWTYPTNTIDPTDGSATTACSWAVQERADKQRFFNEPGFIFGVSVCRPKVYLTNQVGAAAWLMKDARTWLPAMLNDDPATSFTQVAEGAGPLPALDDTTNGGYWCDVRDLLVHGDQFTNLDLDSTVSGALDELSGIALPTAANQKRYPTQAMIEGLFVGGAGSAYCYADGNVSLTVRGVQADTTPTVNARIV